jgi:hypothetical protein
VRPATSIFAQELYAGTSGAPQIAAFEAALEGRRSLRVDSPARLVWPVFPYNPYANAPETSLGLAVGVLTVPIRPQEVGGRFRKQDVRFVLEISK